MLKVAQGSNIRLHDVWLLNAGKLQVQEVQHQP